MDLVDFDQAVFDEISSNFVRFAAALGFQEIKAIPITARFGDNVSSRSGRTPWYMGEHLLDYLETIDVEEDRARKPFRLPVQWVNRPNSDFRGFSGTIASGCIKPGDEVAVLPSGQTTRIKAYCRGSRQSRCRARPGCVTLTLEAEIDVARGDILAAARDRAQVADQFAAHLVWMSRESVIAGTVLSYEDQHNTLGATVTELKHRSTSTPLRSLPPRR